MKRVIIVEGDITEIKVDAIVNAANSSLLGGSGVDGAIHRKGGTEILEECKEIRNKQGKCETGQAVITTAGKLPAKYIIHTVGPVWHGGHDNEAELLASAYRNSLQLAVENGVKTIAFPNISTGIYGFPKTLATEIVFEELKAFTQKETCIKEIYMVCYDDENFGLYLNKYKKTIENEKPENKPDGLWLNNVVLL